MAATDFAIRAQGLHKRYGATTALNGFDLAVQAGSVCGLLGPNGAGKTTAVRILSTLLQFDSGHAEVAGFDVLRQATQVRYRIGLVGQHAAVDELLSGRQNLVMFGRLYHLGTAAARRRASELLEQFQARRRRRQARPAVLGRDAPAARPGRQPDPIAAGAVPRRADHRAGPAQPQRGLGRRPRAGGRAARRCCSPRSTWRRPTSWPARSA